MNEMMYLFPPPWDQGMWQLPYPQLTPLLNLQYFRQSIDTPIVKYYLHEMEAAGNWFKKRGKLQSTFSINALIYNTVIFPYNINKKYFFK